MPSSTLLFTLFSIALLDSINPSAIAMTLVILTNNKNQILKSIVYTLGIYLTNFSIGFVVLMLYRYFGSGFKPDFGFINDLINKPPVASLILELIIGIMLIVYTLKRGLKPKSEAEQSKVMEITVPRAFMLGIIITGVEASTALPYLGAITTMFLNNIQLIPSIGILLIYNLIFVLPPLVILGLYITFRTHFDQIIPKVNNLVANFGAQLFYVGSIILGIFMAFDGALTLIGIRIY